MKRDIRLKYQHLSFLSCLLQSSAYVFSRQNQTLGGEENLFAIQVNVCYILKHLEDRKALSVHIDYTWCDIILIFKLHGRPRLTPRSCIHSSKIRMTSLPCNKYEQITLSYLASVKHSTTSSFKSNGINNEVIKSPCNIRHLPKISLFIVQDDRNSETSWAQRQALSNLNFRINVFTSHFCCSKTTVCTGEVIGDQLLNFSVPDLAQSQSTFST